MKFNCYLVDMPTRFLIAKSLRFKVTANTKLVDFENTLTTKHVGVPPKCLL